MSARLAGLASRWRVSLAWLPPTCLSHSPAQCTRVPCAEWVRTACLPLDALVLGMEEEEQAAKEDILRAQALRAQEEAEVRA